MRGIRRYQRIGDTEPAAAGLLAGLLVLLLAAIACDSCVYYPHLVAQPRVMGHQFDTAVTIEALCIDHDPFSDNKVPIFDGAKGSGVIIDARHVLTAFHVVGDCGYIRDVHIVLPSGKRLHAVVDKEWRDYDVARLELVGAFDTFGAIAPPPVAAPRTNDGACAAVSWPKAGGTCGTITSAGGTSYCVDPEAHPGRHWCRDFELVMSIVGGNSGAPIYDTVGNLIGLVTGEQMDLMTQQPNGVSFGHSLPKDVMP